MNFDKVESSRITQGFGRWNSLPGDRYGAFLIYGPCGRPLKVIASDSTAEIPWEHVSVSLNKRTPNWVEMCFIKDLFWNDDEPVMQLHPRKADYINNHEHCLHLWKPANAEIPLPPTEAVGYKELNQKEGTSEH